MDILVDNIASLTILLTIVIAFTAYSVFSVRKCGVKAYFGKLLKGSIRISVLLGKFLVRAVGFLAQSAKTKKYGKESDIAPSGGILNYRTGKLDDGTDPVGWYEKD